MTEIVDRTRQELFNKPHKMMNVQFEKLLTIGGSALIGALVVNTAPSNAVDSYFAIADIGNVSYIVNAQCAAPFCLFQHFARHDLDGIYLQVNPVSS